MKKKYANCLFIYFIIFFSTIDSNCRQSSLNLSLKNIFSDAKEINKNLITLDTLKIVAGFMPIYAITYSLDTCVHSCFYDISTHKNLKQLPKETNCIADIVLASSLLSVGSLNFVSNDLALKIVSRVALWGLFFAEITKKFLKFIKINFCLRPFNEKYKQEFVYGGFPSGHMMAISYLTVLFGLQNKIKIAVPLAFASSYIFVDYIIRNRHFVSQLVAGIALGAIYAVAVNKTINNYLDISIDKNVLRVDYKF